MKLKGVCYDAGSVMYFNWRPRFDPKTVTREIEIIKNDLHCNAIKITGLDINKLIVAAQIALERGLEVWLCPTMWNKKQDETLAYTVKVAEAAERLRQEYPESIVLVVGGELSLFMNGVLEGRNVPERMAKLKAKYGQQDNTGETISAVSRLKDAEFNERLRSYLEKTVTSVRKVFHGKLTYASLTWESADWNLFDYVSVDHYRAEGIKAQYEEMLRPSFESGKPVVITEFGVQTYQGAEVNGAGLGGNIIDSKSLYFHSLPSIGRFVRPKLVGDHVRDEGLQARELLDQLNVLDKAGVYGAFVSCFVFQIHPYDENPRYDLDMGSMSLVKTYSRGKYGETYPDMTWEPKESFRAVADYFARN